MVFSVHRHHYPEQLILQLPEMIDIHVFFIGGYFALVVVHLEVIIASGTRWIYLEEVLNNHCLDILSSFLHELFMQKALS